MQRSIEEVQTLIQNVLAKLRTSYSGGSDLEYLIPVGYRPEVVLKEGGRKKRCDASFDNWKPDRGEISISFVRDDRMPGGIEFTPSPTPAKSPLAISNPSSIAARDENTLQSSVQMLPEQELCGALAEVERQGRAFIALKWFRDEVLPSKGFAWAVRLDERQAVLARAIESGLVATSKIANPRSPSFPTTTLRLNRNHANAQVAHKRYAPTRIQGEALSETILRDRGVR